MPHTLLSLQQAADRINIPERELFHLVQRDEIPHVKRGDDVLFEAREIREWAQRRILGLPPKHLSAHHRDATPGDFLIERLFRPEWIATDLPSRTKPAVIRDMVALAASTGLLYDDALLQREIEAREALGSTAIGNGAAFLHARYHDPYLAEDSFVILGRTIQSIFFGAQDGEETNLFFLICCTDDELHLHTLARLCMIAHGTMLLSDLRAASAPLEMYDMLRHAEHALLKK